jgi:hypothetical protein
MSWTKDRFLHTYVHFQLLINYTKTYFCLGPWLRKEKKINSPKFVVKDGNEFGAVKNDTILRSWFDIYNLNHSIIDPKAMMKNSVKLCGFTNAANPNP